MESRNERVGRNVRLKIAWTANRKWPLRANKRQVKGSPLATLLGPVFQSLVSLLIHRLTGFKPVLIYFLQFSISCSFFKTPKKWKNEEAEPSCRLNRWNEMGWRGRRGRRVWLFWNLGRDDSNGGLVVYLSFMSSYNHTGWFSAIFHTMLM